MVEFKSEEKFAPVRDIAKIATRYLNGNFIYDFLPLTTLPLAVFAGTIKWKAEHDPEASEPLPSADGLEDLDYMKLFFLFKMFRVKKTAELIMPRFFSSVVK